MNHFLSTFEKQAIGKNVKIQLLNTHHNQFSITSEHIIDNFWIENPRVIRRLILDENI